MFWSKQAACFVPLNNQSTRILPSEQQPTLYDFTVSHNAMLPMLTASSSVGNARNRCETLQHYDSVSPKWDLLCRAASWFKNVQIKKCRRMITSFCISNSLQYIMQMYINYSFYYHVRVPHITGHLLMFSLHHKKRVVLSNYTKYIYCYVFRILN